MMQVIFETFINHSIKIMQKSKAQSNKYPATTWHHNPATDVLGEETEKTALPALHGPDKFSPANIFRLQRTVGNQAVLRMLANRPGAPNPVSQIHRVPKTRPTAPGVIQRKGGGIKGAMKPSAKGTLANSSWFKVTSAYSDYMDATKPETELKYLRKLNALVDHWEAKHGANASQNKKSLVMIIRGFTPPDRADIFARMIGLPPALIAQIPPASLEGLTSAGNQLKQGNLGQADVELGKVKDTIPGFNLVKSMLLRHYINEVNPALAGAMTDEKFTNSADPTAQDDSVQYGTATAKVGLSDAYTMGKYYTKNLDPSWGGNRKVRAGEIAKRAKERKMGMLDVPGIKSLTEQEGKSLNAYSLNTFDDVNPKLRSGLMTGQNDPLKLGAREQSYTLTTISGLNKLKPYKGTVYRHSWLFPGYEEVNQEGAIVSDMAFMSSTYLAESLNPQFGSDIVEIIKCKTGRFLKPLATLYHEDEVLFKPGTRFRVTKRYSAGLDPADPAKRDWPQKMDPMVKDVLKKDSVGHLVKIVVFKEEI